MITLNTTQKIFVGMEPLDFRKGFNGTAGVCRQISKGSHLSGAVFLFLNRSATMIRCYSFDGHGEFLVTKRVAKGKFKWWSKAPKRVNPADIASLFAGAGPIKNLPKPWKILE